MRASAALAAWCPPCLNGQGEQGAGEAFLAGVEALIDQVFFDANIARERVWNGSELRGVFGTGDIVAFGRSETVCKTAQQVDSRQDIISRVRRSTDGLAVSDPDQDAMMTPLTLSLTRTQSAREQPCAICGAEFVPAEDSGSRLLSLMPADQEPLDVLMCGGCHSKWSHGVTVTARRGSESPLVPVLRHPEGG